MKNVTTAILNLMDIFCRWGKLNFGFLWGHAKSYYFIAILLKGEM